VEAVEVAGLPVELRVVLSRGRDEHRERVADVATAAHQQLERVVKHPESELDPSSTGHPIPIVASRARIQFTLPRIALISPLWQSRRNGCVRSHDGSVLVEKRWWKMPNGTSQRGSRRSS
jgi:hypothetical protein